MPIYRLAVGISVELRLRLSLRLNLSLHLIHHLALHLFITETAFFQESDKPVPNPQRQKHSQNAEPTAEPTAIEEACHHVGYSLTLQPVDALAVAVGSIDAHQQGRPKKSLKPGAFRQGSLFK